MQVLSGRRVHVGAMTSRILLILQILSTCRLRMALLNNPTADDLEHANAQTGGRTLCHAAGSCAARK